MEAKAQARFVRLTPMKARRIVNEVRGKSTDDAIAFLRFAPQAAAEPVRKVLESAVANARVKAEQTYKVAYATAYLAAEGSIEERKQRAVLVTADAARDAELAAVVFDNTRAAMRVLGQRLDAGRTIASTIRAEAIATGVGV